jgi:ABC-2 type transport system ATP-binding protein
MQEVEEICGRIAIIDHGKMIAIGTKDELVSLVTDIKTVFVAVKPGDSFRSEERVKELQLMPGVKAASMEESVFRIDISIQDDGIAKIIERIIAMDVTVVSINSEVPNLDTTFLALTGHELR